MRSVAFLLLAAPLSAQGKVHEVFSSFGLHIQDAVDVAADGDVVLVHTGEDMGFAVDGKTLTIVVAQGETPIVGHQIAIRNLSAGQTVVLRGLRIYHNPSVMEPAELVLIENCAGSVRLEDCVIEGESDVDYGTNAVRAVNAASVVLANCTLTAELNLFIPTDLRAAVIVTGSSHVSVLGGSLRGPEGLYGYCVGSLAADGSPGGPAVEVDDGFLLLSGAALVGGQGGPPDDEDPKVCDCTVLTVGGHPGGGGPGVRVGPAGTVFNLDSTIVSGEPGISPTGCPPGPTAAPVAVHGGFYQVLSGTRLALHASTPVSELGTLTLELAGPPSAAVLLAFGPTTGDVFFEPWKGSFFLAPSASVIALGTLSAAGTLSVPITLGTLVPGWESTVLHAQAAGLDGTGVVLGSASTVVILDQSI